MASAASESDAIGLILLRRFNTGEPGGQPANVWELRTFKPNQDHTEFTETVAGVEVPFSNSWYLRWSPDEVLHAVSEGACGPDGPPLDIDDSSPFPLPPVGFSPRGLASLNGSTRIGCNDPGGGGDSSMP